MCEVITHGVEWCGGGAVRRDEVVVGVNVV